MYICSPRTSRSTAAPWGVTQAQKILKVLDLAQKTGAPVVAMCDSNGVRLDEGAAAMNAYAEVFAKMTRLSGVCPMVALVLGPCAGGAAHDQPDRRREHPGGKGWPTDGLWPAGDERRQRRNADRRVAGRRQGHGGTGRRGTDSRLPRTRPLRWRCSVLDLLPRFQRRGCAPGGRRRYEPAAARQSTPDDSEALLAAMADGASFIELYQGVGRRLCAWRCAAWAAAVSASSAAMPRRTTA